MVFFSISLKLSIRLEGLIFKLNRLGVPKYMIKFIINFLEDRCCQIKIDNDIGEKIKIECGVPQGSVLGPLLFLVFINDVPLMDLKHIGYSSFIADDLATFFIFKNIGHVRCKINTYLIKLTEWLYKWRLRMNANKCCYTIFSKNGNKNKIGFGLRLRDGLIPYNSKPLFLGITFDEFLSFKEHFNNLRTRSLKRLNIIKILKHKSWRLDCNILKGIYKALIGSIFEYSFFTVANVSPDSISRIQKI